MFEHFNWKTYYTATACRYCHLSETKLLSGLPFGGKHPFSRKKKQQIDKVHVFTLKEVLYGSLSAHLATHSVWL